MLQRLLNLIETLSAEQDPIKAENQQLRDEISRLKGTVQKSQLDSLLTVNNFHNKLGEIYLIEINLFL